MIDRKRLAKLLKHSDVNIRMDAGRALQRFAEGEQGLILPILESLDLHGIEVNLPLLSMVRSFLPSTEELGELARLYTESLRLDDSYHKRLITQIEKAFLLFPFEILEKSRTIFYFHRELRRIYDRNRGFETLKRRKLEFLWKRLVDFCEDRAGKGLSGDELIYGKVLIEGLCRHREEIEHRVLMNLSRETPWNYHLEEYLIEIAGQLHLEKAVPYLFHRLETISSSDLMHGRIVKSLSRIGTDEIVDRVVELYEVLEEQNHLLTDILSGIDSEKSEQALLRLFDGEKAPGRRSFLASGLCSLFSLEGVDRITGSFQDEPAIFRELIRPVNTVLAYYGKELLPLEG